MEQSLIENSEKNGFHIIEGGMDEMFEHYWKCVEAGIETPVYIHRILYDELRNVTEIGIDNGTIDN